MKFLQKFKQESTWRGLIGILSAFGIVLNPEAQTLIIAGGAGLIGAINFGKKD